MKATTKRVTSALASCGIVFLLLAACGGSGGSEGGGGSVCARYFNALVSYSDRCGGEIGPVSSVRPRYEAACVRALSAPGATNVGGALDRCIQQLGALPCGDDADCDLSGGTLDDGAPCASGYQCKGGACTGMRDTSCGTCAPRTAIGGDCNRSNECVEGARCHSSTGDSGKCVAVTIAKAGERCTGRDGEIIDCEKGLRCVFEGASGTCKEATPAGGACMAGSDCADGLKCVGNTCGPGLPEGADCGNTFSGCAKGLDCNGAKKCAPIVYVKAGEACDMNRRCERGSCDGFSFSSTGVTPGTCVDPLPDGAACTKGADEGPRCDLFAECIDGKCTPDDPAQCK
jgi:hypothetical protein